MAPLWRRLDSSAKQLIIPMTVTTRNNIKTNSSIIANLGDTVWENSFQSRCSGSRCGKALTLLSVVRNDRSAAGTNWMMADMVFPLAMVCWLLSSGGPVAIALALRNKNRCPPQRVTRQTIADETVQALEPGTGQEQGPAKGQLRMALS